MTTLRISQVLLDLYTCPTEPGRWPSVLDELCRTLRVRSAVIQILLRDSGRLRSRWMVRDSRSEAARTLHDRYFSDAVNLRLVVKRSPPPEVGCGLQRIHCANGKAHERYDHRTAAHDSIPCPGGLSGTIAY
jgi:hypothetical protein